MAHPGPQNSQPHGPNHGQAHGLGVGTRLFIYAVIVADLFAVVYFGGLFLLTGSIMPHQEETKVVVAGAEEATEATPAAAAAPAFDLATYVADPVKGAQVAAKCKACHTFEQGGANRTGPNLFGIAGAPVEHVAGFAYSSALTAYKATHPTWTDENLMAFLENPKQEVPGTKMQFNGVRNPQERADLLAWLKTLK